MDVTLLCRMPSGLMPVIAKWRLYRDGELVGETKGATSIGT
jgi:hypothetical protein